MRRTNAGAVVGVFFGAALALAAGQAGAAEKKGETGGKGGLGPAPVQENNEAPDTQLPIQRNLDKANRKAEQEKAWELGAVFETHRAITQQDLASGVLVYNVFGVYGSYRLTDNDSLGLRESFQENFIADPGETGVRSDDVQATFTHGVPLPRDFLFSGTASLSAPTSLGSQKAGLITSPGLVFALNKKFGRYINVSARLSGGVFIVRYAEAEGGAPNPLARIGGGLTAEVVMPFHEPLSFGLSASTGYSWLYNVQSSDPNIVKNGVVADGTYPNQPMVQSYSGEIYGRYTMPSLAGVKSDFTIAVADGDPGIGGTSWLRDGVGYFYLFNRENGGVYASLSVRY